MSYSCTQKITDFMYESSFLDPVQFEYQSGISCEDAILTLLEKMYSHLEIARCDYCFLILALSLIQYNPIY